MFSKPFNLILVYILSVINLLILFLPFILSASPLFLLSGKHFTQGLLDAVYLSFFLISSLMIFYLVMDTVFGFTIWSLTKGSKPAQKYVKKYPYIQKIIDNFHEVEQKFGHKNIKLLISNSKQINAFAIGSMRSRIVVITLGLMAEIRENCQSEEEFQTAIKCIIAHEISHLANKDFLPALLLFANEKATNFVSRLLTFFFNLLIRIVYSIPILGTILYSLIIMCHKITRFFINFFHRYILLKVFNFLKLHVSRQTEYRCDYQGAQACGGLNMAFALSFLGEGGYVTIFSSHPRTSNRIKHVQEVSQLPGKVKVSIINKLSNFISITILFIILNITWNYVSKIEYLQIQNSIFSPYLMKIQSHYNGFVGQIANDIKKHF